MPRGQMANRYWTTTTKFWSTTCSLTKRSMLSCTTSLSPCALNGEDYVLKRLWCVHTVWHWDKHRDWDRHGSQWIKQNPMEICVGVCLCVARTPPINSVQPMFYRSLIGIGSVLGSVTTPLNKSSMADRNCTVMQEYPSAGAISLLFWNTKEINKYLPIERSWKISDILYPYLLSQTSCRLFFLHLGLNTGCPLI